MTPMAFDPQNPPPWHAKLGLAVKGLASSSSLRAPSEGVMAACRLSDEARAFSRACFHALHPHLDAKEKLTVFAQRRELVRYGRAQFPSHFLWPSP